MIFLLSSSVTAVFAGESDIVGNPYFSIIIPDNWAYLEGSNTPEAKNQGFGPLNAIELTPSELATFLLVVTLKKVHMHNLYRILTIQKMHRWNLM